MFDNKASPGLWIAAVAVALTLIAGTLYWTGREAPAPPVAQPAPAPAQTAPDRMARTPAEDSPPAAAGATPIRPRRRPSGRRFRSRRRSAMRSAACNGTLRAGCRWMPGSGRT